MRVIIQGEKGSFHHQAAQLWFHDSTIEIQPANTFSDVFAGLSSDSADYALVAVENSLYGSINEVEDLIESFRYPIVGEIYLRIQQQLIGLPGATLEDIKQVYSHPVALAQCAQFLDTHTPNATRVEYHDTAASVRFIKSTNDRSIAAIAGSVAAQNYDLPIIARNVEDDKANFTRFLVIKPQGSVPYGANKSSLAITTNHTPGALAYILTLFAKKEATLTKIQSRPIIGNAWQYRFHIDVAVAGEVLHQLLATIRQTGATVTILGEYIAGETY